MQEAHTGINLYKNIKEVLDYWSLNLHEKTFVCKLYNDILMLNRTYNY